MTRFSGKTVIITGGATGIGFTAAQLFAREGANVAIAGRNRENGEAAVRKLEVLGGRHQFVRTDVACEADVEAMVRQVADQFGRIDVLVNNAAMFFESEFLTESTDRWHQVFNVIADGAYFCTKHAAASMQQSGTQGTIVNVSSINGYRALKASSHYNAAKGALDQLTRCTALELAPYGIRVNGVAPGFIETELSIVSGVNELETEEFKTYYVGMRKIPAARAGTTDEIAQVIAFLASDASSYMYGTIIPADGGLSITF